MKTIVYMLFILSVFALQSCSTRILTFTKIDNLNIVQDSTSTSGVAWGDYNNDDKLDLLFTTEEGYYNRMYENEGGKFKRLYEYEFLKLSYRCRGAVWGDFNNDGYLDLFLAIGGNHKNFLYINNHGTGFSSLDIFSREARCHSGNWVDFNNNGLIDLFVPYSQNRDNEFYINYGGGVFVQDHSFAITNDGAASITGAWGDYDNDGYMDLFVANFRKKNKLYNNEKGNSFTEIFNSPVVSKIKNSSSGAWGDFDNDLDLDLYVCNNNDFNEMYINNGNGKFISLDTSIIVSPNEVTVGVQWGDIDNDGDLDLYVNNKNFAANRLYENINARYFLEITESCGLSDTTDSRGGTLVDFDNDGDLDLYLSNYNGNNVYYQNNGNDNNWIKIKPVGTESNKSAIGARIKIKAKIRGKDIWQMREITSQSGNRSQSGFTAHFGLGDAAKVDSVVIDWPSSAHTVLQDIIVNQKIIIEEK